MCPPSVSNHSRFQSSPDPKAGCDGKPGRPHAVHDPVSILTRPEGRVRHPAMVERAELTVEFQSSPDPKAGCASSYPPIGCTGPEFQSSPDPKAGCAVNISVKQALYEGVSILTRPEGRVRRGVGRRDGHHRQVSILTRPEGRVRRHTGLQVAGGHSVSILTRPEGRVRLPSLQAHTLKVQVSILTRPEGRVRHFSCSWMSSPVRCFNPHPTRRPGAPIIAPVALSPVQVFQSSPDPKAGCAQVLPLPPRRLKSFNPHPTRRPGAPSRHR